MLDYETRAAQAKGFYEAGLNRVATTPEPEGQKFPCRSRVRIADDLGASMSHFESGVEATVEYVYAHAYGGSDVKAYSLNIDGRGSVAWYYEHQLTASVDASASADCSAEPIHEETGEGIQAVLQELEEIMEKLRFKVDHVMTPRTNLHIYFKGKLTAYEAAVKAVRELQ